MSLNGGQAFIVLWILYSNQKDQEMESCKFCVSDYKGSFLDKVRHEPRKILLYTNHWFEKQWNHNIIINKQGITRETSVNWKSISVVAELWFGNHSPSEVTVSSWKLTWLFGRRKYEVTEQYPGFWRNWVGVLRLFVGPLLAPLAEKRG